MRIQTELREIYNQAIEIFDSDLSWEKKYNLIFSPNISKRVYEIVNLDYYDPDTSYEEDVTAFVKALEKELMCYERT